MKNSCLLQQAMARWFRAADNVRRSFRSESLKLKFRHFCCGGQAACPSGTTCCEKGERDFNSGRSPWTSDLLMRRKRIDDEISESYDLFRERKRVQQQLVLNVFTSFSFNLILRILERDTAKMHLFMRLFRPLDEILDHFAVRSKIP